MILNNTVQIIEREVIRVITEAASVTDNEDSKLIAEAPTSYALSSTIAPEVTAIPEAKFEDSIDTKTGKPTNE